MSRHVDLVFFVKTVGSLRVFAEVAKAFLRQSVPWCEALDKNSNPFNLDKVSHLVHRMKGSCHAVAAVRVAETFRQAEAALPTMTQAIWLPKTEELKKLVIEVGMELRAAIVFSGSDDLPESSFNKLQ